MIKIARIFFAIPVGVFGLQYFLYGRLVGGLPPVPPWTPGGQILAYVTGSVLIAISVSLLAKKEARLSATVLGILFLLCVVFLHAQSFSAILHDGVTRTRAFEPLALAGAAFVLAMLVARESASLQFLAASNPLLAAIGRYLYAFSMIVFGLQHFQYARFIAYLVPSWIPFHLFWAYATGAAFIAAGLAIATQVFSALAARLLGLMFLLWALLLHAPRVAAQPYNGDEWTSAFVALAFSGASFLLAAYSSKTL
jgi:uncharacterized membrane protein